MAPVGRSPTHGLPSLPLGQAESRNLYNGTSEAGFGEFLEGRERECTKQLSTQEAKKMYKNFEKELTDFRNQLKELVKTEKAVTKEGQRSKRAKPKVKERKITKKRDNAIVKLNPNKLS